MPGSRPPNLCGGEPNFIVSIRRIERTILTDRPPIRPTSRYKLSAVLMGGAVALWAFGWSGAASLAQRLPAHRLTPPSPDLVFNTQLSGPDQLIPQLVRLRVPAEDAAKALLALSERLDVAALELSDCQIEITGTTAEPRLVGVVLRSSGKITTVRRQPGGEFRITNEPAASSLDGTVRQSPSAQVLRGPVERMLYGLGPGSAPADARAEALRMLQHRLDLARDIALGDPVTLVLGRRSSSNRAGVLYAAIDHNGRSTQIYYCEQGLADAMDGEGRSLNSGLLRAPLDASAITSAFGLRLHPLLGVWRLHQGVDLRAPEGAPILAAGNGRVQYLGWAGGYGRTIRIDHAAGWQTRYAHLSAWASKLTTGDLVQQGQIIGYVGASGLTTGPHLHFEINRNGVPIDPEQSVPAGLGNTDRAGLDKERRCVADIVAMSGL
jgi:murein DD-endopeptidase MepM/ murein hydrolase activator NlpD